MNTTLAKAKAPTQKVIPIMMTSCRISTADSPHAL